MKADGVLKGKCHCGGVSFQVRLTDGFNTVRRCDCSFCRMRGAVVVSADKNDISIIQGKDLLTLYQFNSHQAKHYFCRVCGIYVYHQRRSNPDQLGVNVACIDGVSPFDFERVVVRDGIHHPSDGSSGIAGVLVYYPAEKVPEERKLPG